MQTDSAYTSMGKVIPSQKPSAPRTTFGSFERKNQNKLMSEEALLKVTVRGREGQGPATYLPSRYTTLNG